MSATMLGAWFALVLVCGIHVMHYLEVHRGQPLVKYTMLYHLCPALLMLGALELRLPVETLVCALGMLSLIGGGIQGWMTTLIRRLGFNVFILAFATGSAWFYSHQPSGFHWLNGVAILCMVFLMLLTILGSMGLSIVGRDKIAVVARVIVMIHASFQGYLPLALYMLVNEVAFTIIIAAKRELEQKVLADTEKERAEMNQKSQEVIQELIDRYVAFRTGDVSPELQAQLDREIEMLVEYEILDAIARRDHSSEQVQARLLEWADGEEAAEDVASRLLRINAHYYCDELERIEQTVFNEMGYPRESKMGQRVEQAMSSVLEYDQED